MITEREGSFISMCIEGYFYGLYSGIFAIYLQCPSKESRTATIIFHAICLLYFLSTVALVCDLVYLILVNGEVLRIIGLGTLSPQLQIDSEQMLLRLSIAEIVVNGCCDFIAQCILIYRCWIVWGKNIPVVIIPSFLAISCLATWLASTGTEISEQFAQDENWIFDNTSDWDIPMFLTSSSASLAVNALVTCLIVFKILRVFLEVKATSVGQTLGSTGGTKLQHIIFVIIESGMALFVVQMIRVMLVAPGVPTLSPSTLYDFVVVIHQMINGITPTLILVRVSMRLSFDDKESLKEAVGSLRFNNPPSDPDSTQQQMGTLRISGGMLPQEINDDIYFSNLPSDQEFPITLRRIGSSSSMPLQDQERNEFE